MAEPDPSPATTADPLGVAVVGLGVGQWHVHAYKQNRHRFRVVAVADQQEELARRVASSLKGARPLSTFEEAVADDDVDVISLCTPPGLHASQIALALEAGKHVVCEKPLVGSLADLDRIAALADEVDRWVMPVFQYRFGHGIQRLRHLVDTGVTGRAFVANADVAWRRDADYYQGWRGTWAGELGGVLLSHAIHALDLLTFVLGPVRSVTARTATRVNDVETEDCAAVLLELADGSLATLSATLGSPEEISRHRFTFEHLSAESGTEPYTHTSEPWSIFPDSPEAAEAMEAALADWDPGPESWEGQVQRLADALATGGALPVTLEDSRASLELITACYRSARTGEVVTLPLADDDPYYDGWRPGAAQP